MPNDNTPVIIGVAQILQRETDPALAKEPVQLMLDAIGKAAIDAENESLCDDIDSVRVIRGIWKYENPAKYVAEKLGLSNVETVGTAYGGNMVQTTVNQSALDILNGKNKLIVITGAENGNSKAKARKASVWLDSTETPGKYDRVFGKEQSMSNEIETELGIVRPIQVYPMFENAIRHKQGESIETHIKRVSELWASFSQVAEHNPNAWLRTPVSAETIRTANASNRMVSFPYPKLMNSNNSVDMSAALIMCSTAKARELGVPEHKWVYPWTGTDAHDTYYVSNRDTLHGSPAIRIAGKKALELADLDIKDIDMIDVYSCFPSAVQVAVNELGLDTNKPLTVTGGLTFGGGPLNNYVMHSIATMVDALRAKPKTKGMITANGGFLTKHAFGIYSTEAPKTDFLHADVQTEVDACPTREVVRSHDGDVTVESYSVMFGAHGPQSGHIASLLPDGRRVWANTTDQAVMADMMLNEYCGRKAVLSNDGKINFA